MSQRETLSEHRSCVYLGWGFREGEFFMELRNLRQGPRWIAALALLWNTGCAPQKVAFEPGPLNNEKNNCSTDLGKTTVLTKMLFIIDMSGSNEGTENCTLGSGCTDPSKKMRFGSVDAFFDDYASRSNFKWNFNIFQGTTAMNLVNGFGDAAAMQSGINTFLAKKDEGNTPYLAALNLAEQTIAADPDLLSAKKPQYLIVFMSDGQPTDATGEMLENEVDRIVNLSPGRITFNTVYYGTGAATEAGLLETLAQKGNGHFLNTNTNPTGLDFAIKDVINVPCPN